MSKLKTIRYEVSYEVSVNGIKAIFDNPAAAILFARKFNVGIENVKRIEKKV